ncbi:MAG: FAD-dependent oxidoreductase [Scytonematopsis contorta HA4267-MV1]|nr:FAD-dependent oxidoreductase [Scytonematopsis contorta HA4267-MV1]
MLGEQETLLSHQNESTSKPIYILGAGPAGLAAAYTLRKQGKSVVVVERDNRVGGLAKSIEYQGFILDYGPHRFYTKIAPVLQLWDEVLGKEQVTVKRLTRIYYGNKYFNYPLKAFEAVFALGFMETTKILTSYITARLFPNNNPKNFAEWVTARFGKRLFEIFFEGYTEKLWGIPCTDISADWAAQRIKGLSLIKAIKTAVLGNDGKVKNLIDQFQFPRLGSGQLYEKIREYLEQQNQVILLNTEVVQLHHENFKVTEVTLKNRQTGEESTVECGDVISSVPISYLLGNMISPAPHSKVVHAARSLKFRNTILVYLIVEGKDLFPDNWLYINDPTVKLGRITNFRNWSPEMLANQYQTPLCCEYWCNFDEPMWQQSDAELLAQAERELRKIKLMHNEYVSAGFVVRLPKTYPIYAGDYKNSLSTIQDYLQNFDNLQLIGRYGAFKYNNQDHSLLMGIFAAENVITPGKHDLWEVNSDSEYVEEANADTVTTSASTTRISRRQKLITFLKELGGYILSGGTATILDVLVFSLLIKSGMWYVFALCISYFIGLTTNFCLSRNFVFRIFWKNWFVQYLVFATVAINSLLANLGLLQLLVNDLNWNATSARLASAACVAFLSFAGHKLYSFADKQSLEYQLKK